MGKHLQVLIALALMGSMLLIFSAPSMAQESDPPPRSWSCKYACAYGEGSGPSVSDPHSCKPMYYVSWAGETCPFSRALEIRAEPVPLPRSWSCKYACAHGEGGGPSVPNPHICEPIRYFDWAAEMCPLSRALEIRDGMEVDPDPSLFGTGGPVTLAPEPLPATPVEPIQPQVVASDLWTSEGRQWACKYNCGAAGEGGGPSVSDPHSCEPIRHFDWVGGTCPFSHVLEIRN